jgi:hypothetical protein
MCRKKENTTLVHPLGTVTVWDSVSVWVVP